MKVITDRLLLPGLPQVPITLLISMHTPSQGVDGGISAGLTNWLVTEPISKPTGQACVSSHSPLNDVLSR